MSRYTGPRLRKLRALGTELPGLTQKSRERRPQRPGQHGYDRRRRRESDYAIQLREKQKLRYNYGLTERQMRTLVRKAQHSKTNTWDKIIELLERRLDNVVFRCGLAPTIPAARQLVTHRHLRVNGASVNIPSYRVRAGDVVSVRERSKKLERILQSVEAPALVLPPWLAFDRDELTARVKLLPDREAVPFPCDVQLVVEYYAR